MPDPQVFVKLLSIAFSHGQQSTGFQYPARFPQVRLLPRRFTNLESAPPAPAAGPVHNNTWCTQGTGLIRYDQTSFHGPEESSGRTMERRWFK